MKKHVWFLLALTLITITDVLHAQGTAFTYQGRLNDGSLPTSGSYDLKFSLFNTPSNGAPMAGPVTVSGTAVSNGLFTATIDFGPGVFTGASNWLEISVSTNAANNFITLSPRQPLTPAPYAIYAPSAGAASSANSVAGSNIVGTIPALHLPAGVITNGQSGVTLSGLFGGDGSGLTNLNLAGDHGSFNLVPTPVAYSQNSQASLAVSILAGDHYAGLACLVGLYLFDISNLAAPVLVSICNVGYPTYSFTVNQNYMYIASGTNGLRTYSVSNFANPIFVSQTNNNNQPCYQVLTSGSYAYVGSYSNILIFSLTNPASPAFVTQIQKHPVSSDGQVPTGLAIAGNYLYSLHREDNALRIFSIADPTNPGLVSLTATFGQSVTLSGNLAYIALNSGGFSIYDVSNPAAPTLVDTTSTGSGLVQNIVVAGNRCYAAVYGVGLNVYDITVSTNPIPLGTFTNTPDITDLVLWDNYALTANFDTKALQILAIGDTANLVAGATANSSTGNAVGVTIAGGGAQTYLFTGNKNGPPQSVGGPNQVGADFGTIDGGLDNTISNGSVGAVIDGGVQNSIGSNSLVSAIGGGYSNTIGANSQNAAIAGGSQNVIDTNSSGAVIGGGDNNYVSTNAQDATIPGGSRNVAGGNYSFAAGQQAQANHQGSFVWADSQYSPFSSTANDQVSFRCQGGVFFTSGNGSPNQTVSWTPGSASWNFTSDRNTKERISAVDPGTVLEKLSGVRVMEWSYIGYPQRHLGPMAQDFHAAFPLNDNDKTLNDADLHGVALAAIQGLNQKLNAKDAEIQNLKLQNDSLAARLNELEAAVKALDGKK